ncbi:MAG: Asp23/Gls24 family envelope stress response protein [Clostridiales bacterium]|nr:Asp23/Gls24 family envelope stress response protein [Clostridiales bacterium]
MAAKLRNEYGKVRIENEVIARIAGLAASDCYGIVGMAVKNMKDGFVQLLKLDSLTKGVKLTIKGGKLSIDLHIIVEYGTNVSAIADTLISNVKYHVQRAIGINVEQINIFVEGVRVDRG